MIIRNKSLWSYKNSWHYVFFLWNLTTKTSHEIFYSTFYTFITILKWHLSLHTTKLLYSLISNTVHTTTIWQLLLFNGNCMWIAQYMSIYLSEFIFCSSCQRTVILGCGGSARTQKASLSRDTSSSLSCSVQHKTSVSSERQYIVLVEDQEIKLVTPGLQVQVSPLNLNTWKVISLLTTCVAIQHYDHEKFLKMQQVTCKCENASFIFV